MWINSSRWKSPAGLWCVGSTSMWAAASQLGPDLQALIALMKDKYGLSYGDIQGLLDEAFGISVSRGGAAQVVLRVAERHEPA